MILPTEPNDTLEVSHAEREIIGSAIRKPRVWNEICHVLPEWFRSWQMQTIWQALQHCYESNGGLAEMSVLTEWLRQNCLESEVEGLLQVMVSCADEYLHGEFVEYYVSVLERAGIRLAFERWAGHIVSMCRDDQALRDIHAAVTSPPIREKGAA